MRGWTVVRRYTGCCTSSFTVEVWEQPTWRWALAASFHWFDRWTYKVPGFQLLERVRRYRSKDDGFLYIPLGDMMDVWCYHLRQRERKVVAEFPITDDSDIVQQAWFKKLA